MLPVAVLVRNSMMASKFAVSVPRPVMVAVVAFVLGLATVTPPELLQPVKT